MTKGLHDVARELRDYFELNQQLKKIYVKRGITPIYLVNPLPEMQEEVTLNQAAPVQNTYYTILDTTENCRVYSCVVRVDTTGENLQVRVTVDGQVFTSPSTGVGANTDFMVALGPTTTAGQAYKIMTAATNWGAFIIEGRSVKIEVRKTTAAGAGNLKGNCRYGKW